ncbi:Venom allergen 5.01 [Schistosoma japonicum]|uniref:Venom allergen 5.01 n=1 Tax=Schistosoma japonicum TaxID=6182 RepID=A0A4Z2CRV7_SCHJA|nr:Venom allergen 5.01 [Schistosoma japonicum]
MIKTILASCLILLFTSQYVETRLPLELEQIYKFHKKVRKGLLNCKIPGQPPARFLEKLKWSKLLARKAQKQANKCNFNSTDPDDFVIGEYETIGQNIAEYPTIEQALKEWFDEHHNYNFEKNLCNGDCKNYKQTSFDIELYPFDIHNSKLLSSVTFLLLWK